MAADTREWTAIADEIYRKRCEDEAQLIRRQVAEEDQNAKVDQQGGAGMLGGPRPKRSAPGSISQLLSEQAKPSVGADIMAVLRSVLNKHNSWMPELWRGMLLVKWDSLTRFWHVLGQRYLLDREVLDQAKRETNAQLRKLGLG